MQFNYSECRKTFIYKKCQLINGEGMVELEKSPFYTHQRHRWLRQGLEMDTNATGWKAVSMAPGCHPVDCLLRKGKKCVSTVELCVGLLLHHVVGFTIPKRGTEESAYLQVWCSMKTWWQLLSFLPPNVCLWDEDLTSSYRKHGDWRIDL